MNMREKEKFKKKMVKLMNYYYELPEQPFDIKAIKIKQEIYF